VSIILDFPALVSLGIAEVVSSNNPTLTLFGKSMYQFKQAIDRYSRE
jgi:hypothetical protein